MDELKGRDRELKGDRDGREGRTRKGLLFGGIERQRD